MLILYFICHYSQVELEIGQLEEYDVYSNRWRSLPSVSNRRRGAAVTASGDKIYLIGGSPWQEPQMGSLFIRALDAVDIFFIKEEVRTSLCSIFFVHEVKTLIYIRSESPI